MEVPAATVAAYEQLRSQYVRGEASADGIGAIAFHGLLRGMQIVLAKAPESARPPRLATATLSVTPDRALVRVLANMVLQVHCGVCHVY